MLTNSCRIDHTDPIAIPELLCRYCNPVKLNTTFVATSIVSSPDRQQELRDRQKQTRYEIWRTKQLAKQNPVKKTLDRSKSPHYPRGLTWDMAKSKWISVQPKESEMSKLLIIPFADGKEVKRARTSVPDTATNEEVAAKVQHAFERGGKSVTSIWVTTASDTSRPVVSEWHVQEGKPVQVSPAKVESEEAKMNGKSPSVKSRPTSTTGVRPGTITSRIVDLISRKHGATIEQIVSTLTKEFPDHKAKGMTITAKIQANKHCTTKEKTKDGSVVYMKR